MFTTKIHPPQQPLNEHIYALLMLADPDRKAIDQYIKEATLLLVEENQKLIAVAVITYQQQHKTAELKNIAVTEQHQGKGIAKKLISEVKTQALNQGAKTLIVGTGNSSLAQLGLYQKCGFRLDHIIKDFFKDYPQPIYENGIQCIDMVMLNCHLHQGEA